MTRRSLATLGAAAALITTGWMGAHIATPRAAVAAPASLTANTFDREPVLIFNVEGGSLGGPIFRQLTVYSSGSLNLTERFFFDEASDGSVKTTSVGSEAVDLLRHQLLNAGAGTLTDNPQQVSDLPLTTITFFVPVGNAARSNTFSYFLAIGQYSAVAQIINDFIETSFGGG